jgi:hypothetical protein
VNTNSTVVAIIGDRAVRYRERKWLTCPIYGRKEVEQRPHFKTLYNTTPKGSRNIGKEKLNNFVVGL